MIKISIAVTLRSKMSELKIFNSWKSEKYFPGQLVNIPDVHVFNDDQFGILPYGVKRIKLVNAEQFRNAFKYNTTCISDRTPDKIDIKELQNNMMIGFYGTKKELQNMLMYDKNKDPTRFSSTGQYNIESDKKLIWSFALEIPLVDFFEHEDYATERENVINRGSCWLRLYVIQIDPIKIDSENTDARVRKIRSTYRDDEKTESS